MIIAIDFDGTCVTHAYPDIGHEIGAAKIIRALVEKGHQIILYTMRSDEYLGAAVCWFDENGIPLLGANKNPDQHTWTKSPKVYAQLYIDDAALGIPLRQFAMSDRPAVDWIATEQLLKDKGIL